MMGASPFLYDGMRVISDASLLDIEPYPRSPSRAKRRAAKGHPQHQRSIPSPKFLVDRHQGLIVAHPIMVQALMAQAKERRAG